MDFGVFGGLSDGEKLRFNHEDFDPSCVGSSKSLLVSRFGDWLNAYCFRCGKRSGKRLGSVFNCAFGGATAVQTSGVVESADGYTERYGIPICRLDGFRPEFRAWIVRAGLGSRDVRRWRIIQVSDDELHIPVTGGIVCRYVGRAYRYRLRKFSKLYYWISPVLEGPLVVVEDILSAVRVYNVGYQSCALLGVRLRDNLLPVLIDAAGCGAIIWLDNDTPDVRSSAGTIQRRLGQYVPATLISDIREPKKLSNNQIIEVLNSHGARSD